MWLAAASGLALGACELPSFGAPDPASGEGREIYRLWQGSVVAALAVGVLVSGLIVYALVRYRRRNDDVPRQNPYNVPLEIAYTVAPIVVVAVLFGFTVATQVSVDAKEDDPAVRVEVVGFQWQWQFRYVDEGVVVNGGSGEELPELVLPVGETTRLDLVSDDVAHSFWVPSFLYKRDLIPGVDNQIDITPDQEGTYEGRCAEFCGLDHWRMQFIVRVVPQADYEAWLEEQRGRQQGGGR